MVSSISTDSARVWEPAEILQLGDFPQVITDVLLRLSSSLTSQRLAVIFAIEVQVLQRSSRLGQATHGG